MAVLYGFSLYFSDLQKLLETSEILKRFTEKSKTKMKTGKSRNIVKDFSLQYTFLQYKLQKYCT